MKKDEIIRMAREAGFERTKMHNALERFAYIVATAERAKLAQPESPYEIGVRLFLEGKGISFIATSVPTDADIADALRGFEDANLVAAAEREACAKVAENYVTMEGYGDEIAYNIRARGLQE